MKKSMQEFEIIDFHTHPFESVESNICKFKGELKMDLEETLVQMDYGGISRFCGAVIRVKAPTTKEEMLAKMKANNDEALRLQKTFDGRYIPGFHVHPLWVEESCKEIDRMHALGVKLIGELVPYLDGWEDYAHEDLFAILEHAQKYDDIVVNFHTSGYPADPIDKMVEAFPRLQFVGAHVNDGESYERNVARVKKYDNYSLDISGGGMGWEGKLPVLVKQVGAEKVLFGSDFPVCNQANYLGCVLFNHRLSNREKELILAENTKRLLGL